jgi:hypothetical protein
VSCNRSGYRPDGSGSIPSSARCFYFPVSTLALQPTQPAIQRVPWGFSRAMKRERREADKPLMIAGAKNDGDTSPLPHTSLWRGNCSVAQQNSIEIVSDELRCGRNRRGLHLRYAHYPGTWKYPSREMAGQR